jgi:hypothetical protein
MHGKAIRVEYSTRDALHCSVKYIMESSKYSTNRDRAASLAFRPCLVKQV